MLVESVSPYTDFSNNCMWKWEEKADKNQSIDPSWPKERTDWLKI